MLNKECKSLSYLLGNFSKSPAVSFFLKSIDSPQQVVLRSKQICESVSRVLLEINLSNASGLVHF
jgi:hypothetical protein